MFLKQFHSVNSVHLLHLITTIISIYLERYYISTLCYQNILGDHFYVFDKEVACIFCKVLSADRAGQLTVF